MVDSWTLTQLCYLNTGGEIFSIKFFENSKIMALNNLGEIRFWNYENTFISETPYFVLSLNKLFKDFVVSRDFIAFLDESGIEFRKMTEMKYEKFEKKNFCMKNIKTFGFSEEYFVAVSENEASRIKISEIFEVFGKSQIKNMSQTDKILTTSGIPSLFSKELVYYKENTLIVYDFISLSPIPKLYNFYIEKFEIPSMSSNSKITYSCTVLKPWPLLLIGTSEGEIIVYSMNTDETPISYQFHDSSITCVEICKNCIISCAQDSNLSILHPNGTQGYCQLLSPALQIKEVLCISDTIHNISDAF